MSVFLDKSTADALRGKMLGNALCDDECRAVATVLAEYEKPASKRRLGMLDLIAYTGSRSQGLSTTQSDADVRVVTGLTGRNLLTFKDFGTLQMPSGDTVVMSMLIERFTRRPPDSRMACQFWNDSLTNK